MLSLRGVIAEAWLLDKGPMKVFSPFLFNVYHKDEYPAGESLEARRLLGNGADFDWTKKYRMYHGESVPGFPQHPHSGFETFTVALEGHVDHADSLGNCGRFGGGIRIRSA
jgi:redox-sensitive bicupin YhaK (pirin superfamily)